MISRNPAWHIILRFLRQRRRRECLRQAVRSVFYNKPGKSFDFLSYIKKDEHLEQFKRAFEQFYGRAMRTSAFRKLFTKNIRTVA